MISPAAVVAGRRARGSVTVEFAVVLPLFMSLVFGMIDGSRLMMARWMVSYAIERGGRAATLRSTTTSLAQVRSAVVAAAPLIVITGANVNVSVNGVTVTTDSAFNARQHGDLVRVWTTYTFSRIVSFVFPTATINLAGATLTRVE